MTAELLAGIIVGWALRMLYAWAFGIRGSIKIKVAQIEVEGNSLHDVQVLLKTVATDCQIALADEPLVVDYKPSGIGHVRPSSRNASM